MKRTVSFTLAVVMAGFVWLGTAGSALAAERAASNLTVNAQLVEGGRTMVCTTTGDICFWPSEGNALRAKVDFKRTFSAISMVCFTFEFHRDLVDQDEEVFFQLDPLQGGYGFLNPDPEPIRVRRSCLVETDWLLDGSQNLTVYMGAPGSARLKSLTVTVVT